VRKLAVIFSVLGLCTWFYLFTGARSVGVAEISAILGLNPSSVAPEVNGQTSSVLGLTGNIVGRFTEMEKLVASDGKTDDNFGVRVAVSGDIAVAGAWLADVEGRVDQGAAYIFVRSGSNWIQQQKLVASDGAVGDLFGYGVAIDGNTAVIGAHRADGNGPDQGAVYTFERNGSTWVEQSKLTASDGDANDRFGADLSLDADTLLVGAPLADIDGKPYQGAAYTFTRSQGQWVQKQKLFDPNGKAGDQFGYSVSIDGARGLVGAWMANINGNAEQGAAYLFERSEPMGDWSLPEKLVVNDGAPGDRFGSSVSVSGDTALVGAYRASPDGIAESGAAYVYVRNDGAWSLQQTLLADDGWSGDWFGGAVALDGDTALVGVPWKDAGDVDQGAAYLYRRTANNWHFQQMVTANDGNLQDHFGVSVALDGNVAVIGAWQDDIGTERDQGSGYIFTAATISISKLYEPVIVEASRGNPIQVRVVLTAPLGVSTVVVTDTIASGLEFVTGSLTSTPGGAILDPANPRQILWNGVVSPTSPVTMQYQVTLAKGVEPGSVLGSEVVATTSAGDHYSVQASLAVEDNAFTGVLMLVYIGADNAVDGFNVGQGDLSDEALRLVNQAELKANTPGVRTIVMLDGPGDEDARIYNLKYDKDLSCPNFQNPYCTGRPIPYVEGVNTFSWGDSVANPTSLAEFVIKASLANPKADTILLSLVGHGGGWSPELLKGQPTKHGGQPTKHGGQPTKRGGQPEDAEAELAGGLLWDVQPSDGLTTADVATALNWARDATGKKVDLLYLDACLMAMSEVAYELRNGADFLLASESWSWTAFPYDQHIADAGAILASGAAAPAKAIGEAWLGNEVAALSEEDNYPFTVSLTDLSKMPSLIAAQNQLADALITAFDVNDAQTRQRMDDAFVVTECVDSNQSGRIEHDAIIGWEDNYCDLGAFATAVMQKFGDNASVVLAAQKVRTALAETVVANEFRSGIPHTYSELPWNWSNLTGLTIYLPLRQDDWKRRYYNDLFLPSSVDSRWGALLTRYWQGVSQPDPTAHPDPSCPETGCGMAPAPLPVGSIKVVATPHDSGIQLQWWVTPASAVAQFDIQRVLLPLTNAPDLVATIPNPVPAPPQPYVYSDAGAERGKEYCYQVIATSQTGGALAYSNFVCASFAMSSTPSIPAPTVSVTSTGILVEWDAVQMASTAAGYRLYRSTNRGPRVPVADTLFSTGQYLDETIWQGVEYCYKVHAIGQNGEPVATSGEACISLGAQPQYFFLPAVYR